MYNYKFQKPFTITHDCEDVNVAFISMPAPGYQQALQISLIESTYSKCLTGAMKATEGMNRETQAPDKQEEKEKTIDEQIKEVLTLLTLGGEDLGKCYLAMKECIVKTGKAKLADEIDVDGDYFNEINPKEAKRMLAWFIVNFTDTSL